MMRTLTRPITVVDPPAEGDWDLDEGDHVGEDE